MPQLRTPHELAGEYPVIEHIKRFIKRCRGYSVCPECHELAVRWQGLNSIDPDGPPIVQWWTCTACGAYTDVQFTSIFESAAKQMGYEGMKDFVEKNTRPK